MSTLDTSLIQPVLNSSQTFTILIPKNPLYDHVASGLALKLSLETAGKRVTVACPDPMTVEFNRLVGVDAITSNLGGRNLLITFGSQTDVVDKISYHVENGDLRLVITPKEGAPNVDHSQLQFVPGTAKPEVLILVGALDLTDFGHIYTNTKEHFQASNVIALSHTPPTNQFAHYHFSDAGVSSLCELTTHFLNTLTLTVSDDAATNLLSGIEITTADFKSPAVSAGTFEAAASLLKKGARRHNPIKPSDFPAGAIPQGDSTPGTAERVQEIKSPPADWVGPKIYNNPPLI